MLSQKKWKTESTDDNIKVKSCISDTILDKESKQLVEYTIKGMFNANYKQCADVLKDLPKHKKIFDYTEKSIKVKELSADEYLIYYFLDMPWPIPNSDSVVKMKFSIDEQNKTAFFKMTASPKAMKNKGVKRLPLSISTYKFKQISENKLSVVATTYSVATMKVPDWITASWIPEGPADILRRIVKLSKEK